MIQAWKARKRCIKQTLTEVLGKIIHLSLILKVRLIRRDFELNILIESDSYLCSQSYESKAKKDSESLNDSAEISKALPEAIELLDSMNMTSGQPKAERQLARSSPSDPDFEMCC